MTMGASPRDVIKTRLVEVETKTEAIGTRDEPRPAEMKIYACACTCDFFKISNKRSIQLCKFEKAVTFV